MKIKLGLKLWSTNRDLLPEALNLVQTGVFQYIELKVVPGTDLQPFATDIPFVIHAPDEGLGFDIGDSNQAKTRELLRECLDFAKTVAVEYVILHAGRGPMCSAVSFLDSIDDHRIVIENMPKVGIDGAFMIGFIPDHISDLKKRFGFCLDFGHAIKAARSLGVAYKDLVGDFMKQHPDMFHVSDGFIEHEIDEHLPIGSGNFDISYLKRCVEKSDKRLVTLETPRNISLSDDVENAKKFLVS